MTAPEWLINKTDLLAFACPAAEKGKWVVLSRATTNVPMEIISEPMGYIEAWNKVASLSRPTPIEEPVDDMVWQVTVTGLRGGLVGIERVTSDKATENAVLAMDGAVGEDSEDWIATKVVDSPDGLAFRVDSTLFHNPVLNETTCLRNIVLVDPDSMEDIA